ncbi:MAG: DUF4936 family protein [Burkholderiales bacterium]
MLNFYIYYRVNPAHAKTLEPRVRAMQLELQEQTGAAGRLLKKHHEPLLWMEIYESVAQPDLFADALMRAEEHHGLRQFIEPGSQRHTECFESF